MSDPKVGVLTEQGYFGEGFGFNESTGEDAEKIKEDLKDSEEKR